MTLNLSDLHELSFQARATKIDRKQIDKLIRLAEDFTLSIINQASEKHNDEEFNYAPALDAIIEAPKTEFCLYCLAIIHCYSLLESNRNEILGTKLYKIEELNKHLASIGIKHKDVNHYNDMEEFRLINNAIKHNKLSSSNTLKTRTGKEYSLRQLKLLYKNNSNNLEKYLKNLYDKYHSNIQIKPPT